MPQRPLGKSGLEVSAISIGSWRTYERISRDAAVGVLRRARELGINFLEVARYDDESGTAPIASGYSEVCFGEAFAAADWPRDEVLIANKLWWEFWPEQDAFAELEASLGRTGLDHFDFLYSDPTPPELRLEEVVATMGALLAAGHTRGWGVVNWRADRIAEAVKICKASGVEPPAAAQLAYSLVQRDQVEDPALLSALDSGETSVVASFALAGGILTGKYLVPFPVGRMVSELGGPEHTSAVSTSRQLVDLATEWEAGAAALAIAFALTNPRVSTVLLGVTNTDQLDRNLEAVHLAETLDEDRLGRLARITAPG